MRIRTPIGKTIVVRMHERYYFHLLFVLFCWSLAMTFDYHDQVQEANYWAAKHERDFTECLKGKWRHTDESGTEWGCLKVEYNEPRRSK